MPPSFLRGWLTIIFPLLLHQAGYTIQLCSPGGGTISSHRTAIFEDALLNRIFDYEPLDKDWTGLADAMDPVNRLLFGGGISRRIHEKAIVGGHEIETGGTS